jgi:hypothetical protein
VLARLRPFPEIIMQVFSTRIRVGVLALAVGVLAGCASSPEIQRDTNPTANFANFKTFGFFSPLATDRAGYESVLTARLKETTRAAMEGKGYVYRETGADLLLNFFANVQDKQEIRSTPASAGYYGYRRGYYGGWGATAQIDTINYQEGTLTIDLVDAKQKALMWHATAVGTISDEARKSPGPAIAKLVTDMMSPLPGPGAK